VLEQRREHIVRQVIDSLIVDVVLDVEEAIRLGIGRVDGLVPDVLGALDQLGVVHQVTLGVEVEVNGVIAEDREDVLAVLCADGVWWPIS
jgi:hypothetical protein